MACSCCVMPAFGTRKFMLGMTDDTKKFSEWLTQAMKRRGVEKQTAIAAASGVAQSTISSYLSGARTPEKQVQVEKLVRALLPEDADEGTALYILNTGLLAAGLAPVKETGSDHEVIEYLRGQPESVQNKALQLLKTIFDEEDKKDNARNVGKRAD